MNIANALPCTDGLLVAPSRELEGQQISHIFEIEYFTESSALRPDMPANEEDIRQSFDEADQQDISPLVQSEVQPESITTQIYLKTNSTRVGMDAGNEQEAECTSDIQPDKPNTVQNVSTGTPSAFLSAVENASEPLAHTRPPTSEQSLIPTQALASEKEHELSYEESPLFAPISAHFLSVASYSPIEDGKKNYASDNISASETVTARERKPSASIFFQRIDHDTGSSFDLGPQLAPPVKIHENPEIAEIGNARDPISSPADRIDLPRPSDVRIRNQLQIQNISDRTLTHPIDRNEPDEIYRMSISKDQDQNSDIQSSSSFPDDKTSGSSGWNPPLASNSRAVASSKMAARSMDTDRSDTRGSETETSTHTAPIFDRSIQSQIEATADHGEGTDKLTQTISKPHPPTTPHNEMRIVTPESDNHLDGEASVAPEMSTARAHRPPISLSRAVDLAINRIVRNELGEVEIVLTPEELGTIRINISGSERLQVHFTADRAETIDLMRRNSDLLEQKLQGDGFGGAEVSFSFSAHSDERHKRDQKDGDAAQLGADEKPSSALPVTSTLSRPNPLGTSINIRL